MPEPPLPTPPAVIEGFRIGPRIRQSGVLAVHSGMSKLELPVEVYFVGTDAMTSGFEADDFIAAVRRAATVHHETLLPFITGGREGGLVFAVAKSAQGRTLDEIVARDGPLPEGRALALAAVVAGALEALERAGMRHGDLAPQRIVSGAAGALVVRPPRLLPAALSPRNERYQAPEEARGGENGVVSDLFVLGLILVEAMTGQHPLAAAPDARRALRDWTIPDLASLLRRASPELRAVVARLLAPEAAKRYSCAAEASRAIADAAGPRPETAPIALPVADAPIVRPLPEPAKRTPGRLYLKARLGEAMFEIDDDQVFVGPMPNDNVRALPSMFPEALLRIERAPAADVVHCVAGEMRINGKAVTTQPLADGDRVEAGAVTARYERSARSAMRATGAGAAAGTPAPSNPVAAAIVTISVLGTLAAVGWAFLRYTESAKRSADAKALADRAQQAYADEKQRLGPGEAAPAAKPADPVQTEKAAREAYEAAAQWARRHPADPMQARGKFFEVWQRYSESAYGMLARLDANEIDRRTRPVPDRRLDEMLRTVESAGGFADDEMAAKLRQYVEEHSGTLAGERAHAALVRSQALARGRFDSDMASIRAAIGRKDWPAAQDLIRKVKDYVPFGLLRDEVDAEARKVEQGILGLTPREGAGGDAPKPPERPPGKTPPKEPDPPPKSDAEARNQKAEELFQSGRRLMETGKEPEAMQTLLEFLRSFKDTPAGARYDVDARRRIAELAEGPAGVTGLFRGKVERTDKTRWKIAYDFEDAAQLADFRDVLAFDIGPRSQWKPDAGAVKCSRGAGALVLDAVFAANQFTASVVVNPERAHDIGVIFMDPSQQKNYYLYTLQNTYFALGKGPNAKPFLENAICLFGIDMWRDTPPGQLGFVRKCGSDDPQLRSNEPIPIKCGKSEGSVWMHFEGNRQLNGSAYGDKKYEFPGILPGVFVLNSAGTFDSFVVEGTLDAEWMKTRWRAILSGL